MEFKKGMKKALSVLLSLSMVVTGITVGGKEAKAEGEEVAYAISFDGNKKSYEGTVQGGTVTIKGKVTADDESAVYGKIKLTSNVSGFTGTVDYVKNGVFEATVDISQVEKFTTVPVKVEFTKNGTTQTSENVSIYVTTDSGILATLNASAENWCTNGASWCDKCSGEGWDISHTSALIDEKNGSQSTTLSVTVPKTTHTGLMVAYVAFEDLADNDRLAKSEDGIDQTDWENVDAEKVGKVDMDKVTVTSVTFNEKTLDDSILAHKDLGIVTVEPKEYKEDPNDEKKVTKKEWYYRGLRIAILNPYDNHAYVNVSGENPDSDVPYGDNLVDENGDSVIDASGDDLITISVTFSYAADATAAGINPATAAAVMTDVSSEADPTPAPAPSAPAESSDPKESTTPATNTSVTTAAAVTAVGMAPQAMTATAGAVATTFAAVLTVTGSSLDVLKVNNTEAVNNVTVSAVSTSGIKVELKAPANVTSKSAAATFAAVVTVPANCATGNYGLTASVGAVKANVATVSVIAAAAPPVQEDVHTTKLKVKTANGTNKTALMGVGEKATLKVVKTPKDSVDEVTAVSAKAKIVKASINKKGSLVLKAKKAGTAKVTVSSGEVSKKITVTVKNAPKKLTLKDGKKAAKKTVGLSANTKKKAVKKTYKITLPKNTASYDYTVKKTGKVVKSAVVKTSKKNVQTLVVTVKKKAKGRGKVIITSNANKKAKAQVNVIAK